MSFSHSRKYGTLLLVDLDEMREITIQHCAAPDSVSLAASLQVIFPLGINARNFL